jgi:hypothetical protein
MAAEVAADARRKIEDAICGHAQMLAHGSAETRQGALDTILAIAAPLLAARAEIDAHRWYVIVRITLPDGSTAERVIYDPDQSGLVVYDSREAFEAVRDA